MRTTRESRLTRIALIVFFFLAACYGVYELRGQVLGPAIVLESAPPITNDSFIRVRGQAYRMTELSMNGGPITVTENGSFDEGYVLAPGDNRIVFDAKDAYGHTTERVVEVVYTAPLAAKAAVASSSPATLEQRSGGGAAGTSSTPATDAPAPSSSPSNATPQNGTTTTSTPPVAPAQ